jgi:peroxiredoxin
MFLEEDLLLAVRQPVALAALALASVLSGLAAVIPRPAPELTVQLPGGKTAKLSQFRGKIVALEFILTTCPDCQQTAQILQSLQQELGPKGFQALGVALNDNAAPSLPDFTRILKIGFPVGTGSRDAATEFLQHPIMTTMMMPQLVLIDRSGRIQAQLPGNHPLLQKDKEKNIRSMVQKLMSGAALPATTTQPAPSKKKTT